MTQATHYLELETDMLIGSQEFEQSVLLEVVAGEDDSTKAGWGTLLRRDCCRV
jgi:hypothetical protein